MKNHYIRYSTYITIYTPRHSVPTLHTKHTQHTYTLTATFWLVSYPMLIIYYTYLQCLFVFIIEFILSVSKYNRGFADRPFAEENDFGFDCCLPPSSYIALRRHLAWFNDGLLYYCSIYPQLVKVPVYFPSQVVVSARLP